MNDTANAFIAAACIPRDDSHQSGNLDDAERILAHAPDVARASIHAAAILADEEGVRAWLARDPALATAPGGPHGWDALTHLCFSRYLRLDPARHDAFVRTALALLDAGALATTGFTEFIDTPPRPLFESAIYGAAGIARHVELTRLLIERGADPNDEETPYHVPESYDNAVLTVLLDSGKLNADSLATLLLRKADWHDLDGMRLVLAAGGDPNRITRWGLTALQQALRRDNALATIEALLDAGASPAVSSPHGPLPTTLAARRGRGDVLAAFEARGVLTPLAGVDRLAAACARGDRDGVSALRATEPALVSELVAHGGALLAHCAGVGNAAGVACLLDCGVRPDALYAEGDGYFDIAPRSTALHVAAWRGWPAVVALLIARGAPVNATDGRGRTALMLAVRACVDSYWTSRRSPDSVRALLDAGASTSGVPVPCGYDAVDDLLARTMRK